MKSFCKGRFGIWILLNIMGICSAMAQGSDSSTRLRRVGEDIGNAVGGLVKFQKDSALGFAFDSKEQALDTLIVWMLMKKPIMASGYLPKDMFVAQWRSHDTATLKQVVEGTWLTYQFKFKKSLLKTQIKLKKSKVNFKMVEVMPRPRTTISIAGDGITKYDYTVKYKKIRYILSFQLWWIDGKAYWVNEVAWAMGA